MEMRIVLEVPETEDELKAFHDELLGRPGSTLEDRVVRLMQPNGAWRFASLQLECLQRFGVSEIVPMRIFVQ